MFQNFEKCSPNIEGRWDQFEAGSQNHITKQRKEIPGTKSELYDIILP